MFVITILLAILGLVGTDLFVPSLPKIAAIYNQTPNVTQLTISLFLTGFAISQLFYGPISDYTGRKIPLIIGVVIFIIGSFICFYAQSFDYLLIGRIIQGCGVGAGLSLARVILRDSYNGTLLAVRTSQVGMFVSLTPPLAPLVGGFLQDHFGIQASFLFMLFYGIVLLFLLLFFFKETIQIKDKTLSLPKTILNYKQLLKNSAFLRFSIIAGLAFASIILYANVVPFIIQTQLHLSAFKNGLILLLGALGISFASLISSRVVKSISSTQLINIGLLLFVLGGIILFVSDLLCGINLFYLVPAIFLISISCGLIFPNAIVLCFADIRCNIGIAGSLYGAIQMATSMSINLLLNILPYQSQGLLGLFYLAIGLSGLVMAYGFFPKGWFHLPWVRE